MYEKIPKINTVIKPMEKISLELIVFSIFNFTLNQVKLNFIINILFMQGMEKKIRNYNSGKCRGNHGELPCSFYKSGKYIGIIGDFKGGRGGSPCPPL